MAGLLETLAHLFHPRWSNNHRPKLIHPDGFGLLVVLAVVGFGFSRSIPFWGNSQGAILGFSSSITVSKVVDGTNAEREALGLSPVTFNASLAAAAAEKASDMFADQYWAHFSPSGKTPWDFMKKVGYRYTVAGENLARDFLETDQMMKAWMNSPTHRDNIVNPKYRDIGIAVVNGTLQGVETTLVVQMFGTTQTSALTASIDAGAQRIDDTASTSSTPALQLEEKVVPTAAESPTPSLAPAPILQAPASQQAVLSTSIVERINRGERPPLFSPLHLSKAFFLGITMLVLFVLVYDTVVIENIRTVRFVGKNAAHFLLFLVVFFLILFFKSGAIV